MTVRLTAAQARQLNIPGVDPTPAARGKGRRRDRTTVPDRECARNVCTTCGLRLAGETAEARHNLETGHGRYQSTAQVTA